LEAGVFKKFFGFDKKVDDALREARGEKVYDPIQEKIAELESKLETARLSSAQIVEIQRELKRLKSIRR
jgi:hypothetical protein